MSDDLITTFENKGTTKWFLPKGILLMEGEFFLPPKARYEFQNKDNGSIYAPYERIVLVAERDKETGEMKKQKVECYRRKGWKPPEVRGWTIALENMTGDPRITNAYREGTIVIQIPYGIPITLWNADPRASMTENKRLYRTEDEVVVVPMPGFGSETRIHSGHFVGEKRDEKDLRKLESDRLRIQHASTIELLRDLERQKVAAETTEEREIT